MRALPIEGDGFYMKRKGKQYIYFNPALTKAERRRTLFELLSHHLLHYDGEQRKEGRAVAVEVEAAAFAACALIPRPMIENHTIKEISQRLRCPEALVEFRAEVLKRWSIYFLLFIQ